MKKRDLLFLLSAILSIIIFVSFGLNALYSTSLRISFSPFILLRYQLIFTQITVICMFGVLFHLLKARREKILYLLVSLLGLLLVISFILPDNALFGSPNASQKLTFPGAGREMLVSVAGFTIWRVMVSITMLIFLISAFILLALKTEPIGPLSRINLFTSLVILFLAAFFDHLVDLGKVNSVYMMPFAHFLLYVVLIFSPFVIILREIFDQQSIIRKEKKLQDLVDGSRVIVVELNRMGHVEYTNSYFYKLTGYTEEEVIGKDWFEFFIPRNEFYNVQSTFLEILEFNFNPEYVNPILTKNKEEVIIHWYNVRTHDQKGAITGSISLGCQLEDRIQTPISDGPRLAQEK